MLDPTETTGGILSKQAIICWIAIWPWCQEQHLHSRAKGLSTLATTNGCDLLFFMGISRERTR